MEQQGLYESVLTITYFFNVTLFSSQLGHLSLGHSGESSVIHSNSLMTLPNSPFAAVSLAAGCSSENSQNKMHGAVACTGQQVGCTYVTVNCFYLLLV